MDWIIGLQKAIDYIEDNLTETIVTRGSQRKVFHQAITFREYLVSFAVLQSENIFVIADYRLQGQNWPQVM